VSSPFPPFTHIKFGDNLGVTDEGAGVIRVDSSVGSSLEWEDVGSAIAAGLSTAFEVRAGISTPVTLGGGVTLLQWGAKVAGTALTTTSVPTAPRVLNSGLYAVTTVIRKVTPTIGDSFATFLEIGSLNSRNVFDVRTTGHGVAIADTLIAYITPSTLLQSRVNWTSGGSASPDNFVVDSISIQQIAAF